MKRITLNIPDNLISDYTNDKFADFFNKLLFDISEKGILCKGWEREIIASMKTAFKESEEIADEEY